MKVSTSGKPFLPITVYLCLCIKILIVWKIGRRVTSFDSYQFSNSNFSVTPSVISSIEIFIRKCNFVGPIGWQENNYVLCIRNRIVQFFQKITSNNDTIQKSNYKFRKRTDFVFLAVFWPLYNCSLGINWKIKKLHLHQYPVCSNFTSNGNIFDASGQSNSCFTVSTGSIASVYASTENCIF